MKICVIEYIDFTNNLYELCKWYLISCELGLPNESYLEMPITVFLHIFY